MKLKKYVWLLLAMWLPMGFVACSDDDEPQEEIVNPEEEQEEETSKAYQDERVYANFFGYWVMYDVYLWKQDIGAAFKTWNFLDDPKEVVANARYKENGKDVDKWTEIIDKFSEWEKGWSGQSTGTYGFGIELYLKENGSDKVVGFITYTYPGSPAEKAGLKRGDVILQVNGKDMDKSNYKDALFASSSLQVGVGSYDRVTKTYSDVKETYSMQSVAMYEDPILMTKVFDCGGKKVGYLHYTSFNLDSSRGLYDVCKELKAEGISELILDLRYNGGGYVFTEDVLASLLAPEAEVKAGSVFETEVWNDEYMAYFEEEGVDLNTYFYTDFNMTYNGKTYDFNTSDANLNLNKIYAIVDSGTASASESILVGLMPYMDIEIIGQQTHGKYCAGFLWKAEEWYQDVENNFKEDGYDFATEYPEVADWKKYIGDWGIYVMYSRYADKNGENPCMPNGLTPDVAATDLLWEPYPLGDEREAMLNVALQRAGKTDLKARSASRSAGISLPVGEKIRTNRNPLDGKLIFIGKKNRKSEKVFVPLH